MDPGLARLSAMVYGYLSSGIVWWKMPVVLIMTFTFFEKERMMKTNLFDSYPSPLPTRKQKCDDPVLGTGLVGCYKASKLELAGFVETQMYSKYMTPEMCVTRCKDGGSPYAALYKGERCFCGKDYPSNAEGAVCDCRNKCKGDKRKICGGKKYMSLYRTYFCTKEMMAARQIDGTCNDANNTVMGSRLYRLGRNFDHKHIVKDENIRLLEPNPRTISRKLLKRKSFVKAPWMNLFAVAWVQFMVHDWFDHGHPVTGDEIEIQLDRDDPMYNKMKGTMKVSRTRTDPCWEDPSRPKAFQNHVTHWWDASQIYGSDKKTNEKVRAMHDGKLNVDDEGFIPTDEKTKIEVTGFSNNWWVGLSLMHNIFTREHNFICDMLKPKHPYWSDQKLFDTARLITSALIAKIHVVEWTPTILNNEFVDESVPLEWFGNLSHKVLAWLGRHNITINPKVIHANIGYPKDLRGVPFSLTEEFAAVYRFHSLLPDDFNIHSMKTGKPTGRTYKLPDVSYSKTRDVFDDNNLEDIVYTFGTENPGASVLNNFPKTTADLHIPRYQGGGALIDLATIDIIRDRERGIPRYNQFRRLLRLKPLSKFEDFAVSTVLASEIKEIYNNDIESVDLLVGSLAEHRPPGFGFGETSFQLFLLMAHRRMVTDRFFTDDFKKEYYTEEGISWVNTQSMKDVLLRAFPDMLKLAQYLEPAKTAFFDWNQNV